MGVDCEGSLALGIDLTEGFEAAIISVVFYHDRHHLYDLGHIPSYQNMYLFVASLVVTPVYNVTELDWFESNDI